MKYQWLLLLALGLFLSVSADAQTHRRSTRRPTAHKKQTKKSETTDFWKDQVWYGGSIEVGYNRSRDYSQFVIGLTPMMGFKIKETPFSVGPRVGITYMSLTGVGSDGQNHRVGLPSYTMSAFARVKFLQMLFLHTEYELEWKKQAYVDSGNRLIVDREGEILTEKIQRDNFYIGAGYNSGGYELMVLYNLNIPENSLEQPFSYRAGFTWNF